MPMTVLSGFGIGFWRLSRKAALLQREAMEQAVAGASDPAVQAVQGAEPRAASPVQNGPQLGRPGAGFVFP
jgi:hypothetical protein